MSTSKAQQPLSLPDQQELDRFEVYLRRRMEKPDEPQFVAYGEVYGEVVFEDKSVSCAPGVAKLDDRAWTSEEWEEDE